MQKGLKILYIFIVVFILNALVSFAVDDLQLRNYTPIVVPAGTFVKVINLQEFSTEYNDDTTNLILATYANKKEGCEVFDDLCEAISSGVTVYRMPGRKLSDGEKEGKNLSWNDDGYCPVCGKYDKKDPFGSKVCPNCGAKMIQEEEHGN